MFIEGERPLLRLPGELLLPDRNPFKHRISVMPISTDPVRLRVRVTDLLSLDGQRLDAIEMRVTVQLNADEPRRILEFAAKRGPQLGGFLNDQVREGIENTARAGIKMNTRADLHRDGVAAILRDRWLPRGFVGLLRVVDFDVVTEEWAAPTVVHRPHVSPPPASRAGLGPDRSESDPAEPGPAELHADVRLLSVWRRWLPAQPRGIAAAKVGDDGCVVAVVDSEIPAFEGRQLWEDFAGMLGDRHLRLLVCRGTSHEEIVRSWFSELGLPSRLDDRLGVEVSGTVVEVRLPAELDEDLRPRWTGLDSPAVGALRRLLRDRKLSIDYERQE
jgi:hypothetical protein